MFKIPNFFTYNLLFWIVLMTFNMLGAFSLAYYSGTIFDYPALLGLILPKYLFYWVLSFLIFEWYLKIRNLKPRPFILANVIIALIFSICHKFLADLSGVFIKRLLLGADFGYLSEIYLHIKSVYFDIPINMIIYTMIILILISLDYYHKFADNLVRLLEIENQLGKSQLRNLKMQLQPHFLFNAFNTIAMMIRQKKNEEAIKMIVGLSDMLRHSLSNEPQQFVPLKQEIELTRKYLEIETARFGERLDISWNVQEGLDNLAVPPLVLQPIVENAFKHGISKNPDHAKLMVTIRNESGNLWIEVYNSGSSLPINWDISNHKGIGISNTLNRLLKLYQNDFKFLVEQLPQGVAVKVRIPAKTLYDEKHG